MNHRRVAAAAVSVLVPLALATLAAAPLPPARAADDLAPLKKEYVAACTKADVDGATSAVFRIAKLDTEKAVQYLVDEAIRLDGYPGLDESDKLRIFDVARETLSKVSSEEAREFLFDEAVRLKRARDAGKKLFLADVIGRMSGDDATDALVALLGSKKFPSVQMEAIEALVPRADTTRVMDLVMDPVIDILEADEKDPSLLWRTARNALVAMTGYDFDDAAGWRSFWATRKGSFDPKKDRGEKKPGDVRSVQREVPTIFEKEILSKRLVFIIDISKSMHVKDPVRGGEAPIGGRKEGDDAPCPVCEKKHRGVGLPESRMRLERVKRELATLLERLPDDVKFNILAFSTDVLAWRNGDELHQATPKNVESAVQWTRRLTYEEFTSTDRALKRAFAHREANAFYLLSDGAPFREGEAISKPEIFEMVRGENRLRKVRIFTLGFSEDADHEFLRELAARNGGTFDEVY